MNAETIVIDGHPHAIYSYDDDTGHGLTMCQKPIGPQDVGGGLEDPVTCEECAKAIEARRAGPAKESMAFDQKDINLTGLKFLVAVAIDGTAMIVKCPEGHEPFGGAYLYDNFEKGLPEKLEPGIYEITFDFDFQQGYFEGYPADGESSWEYTATKIEKLEPTVRLGTSG